MGVSALFVLRSRQPSELRRSGRRAHGKLEKLDNPRRRSQNSPFMRDIDSSNGAHVQQLYRRYGKGSD
jgi:hypothetical protein